MHRSGYHEGPVRDYPAWSQNDRDAFDMNEQPVSNLSKNGGEFLGNSRVDFKRQIKQHDTDKAHKTKDSLDVAKPSLCQGIGEILTDYADHCSLNGAPYISISTWWLSRLIWCVLLATAMGFMGYHLYILIQKFLSYPTQNSIQLGFSSLQFPAVTICNVNAIRKSQVWRFSEGFRQLVNKTEPEALESALNQLPDDDEAIIDNINFGVGGESLREEVSNTDLNHLDGYGNSWEMEGKTSQFTVIESEFTDLYATENITARRDGGHKLEDMLLSCSFAGKQCNLSLFTERQSSKYGNCFSLEYSKFVSRSSGPESGLQMIFYLETDEYLKGVTADKGLHVVVHPQNSLPFPEDEGVAVSSGENTFVALRLWKLQFVMFDIGWVHVERMGKPYGECTSQESFIQKYNVSYSRKTCQEFCKQQLVYKRCGCRDEIKEGINRLLKMENMTACRNKTEMACLKSVAWNYNQDNTDCSCNTPCSDNQYVKTLSSRPWPSEGMINVLKKLKCFKNSTVCDLLSEKKNYELDDEFLKLNIFFEDLNYENITEQASYEVVQFVSDVGGTLGLWIGLSLLSVFEIFQLVIELFRFLSCCMWRRDRTSLSERNNRT